MTTMLWLLGSAFAADHVEADLAAADAPADITDFYAWHNGTHVVAALNFSSLMMPGEAGMYDADVIYGIHIDTDNDAVADNTIWIRFGQDDLGNWGLEVQNFPGAGAPIVGPVESVVAAPGGQVFAGVREDPFRFDLVGFNATLHTGTLSFVPETDFFEGTNVTSIVLSMDQNSVGQGADSIQMWATTARATN